MLWFQGSSTYVNIGSVTKACLIQCRLNSDWIDLLRPIMIFQTTNGILKKWELNEENVDFFFF